MMYQIHSAFPSLLLGVIRHQVGVLFMFFCFFSPAKTEVQSTGYRLERDHIVFVFHVDAYKKCISNNGTIKTIQNIPLQSVSVVSEANGWSEKVWQMNKISDGWYELRRPFTDFTQHNPCQFTFVLNGMYWVQPEQNTPNRGDARSIKALGFLKVHHYNLVASFPTPTIQRHIFRLAGYSKAKAVFVAGAFNNWNPSGTALSYNNNEWSVAVTLHPGGHSYKFIVDGEWMTDPANPITVHDGNGHTNSFFIIPSTNGPTEFSLRGYPKAKYVSVAGSFNGWNPEQYYFAKEVTPSISEWKCRINLRPGLYEYKFIVDGQWITDPANTLTAPHQSHDANSILILPSTEGNVSFTLKGYKSAKTVALAGTFNAWSDRRTMFFRNGDTWICRVTLKPGRYEYKFIVDGEWMLDPTNKNIVDNEFGTGNNLLTVK